MDEYEANIWRQWGATADADVLRRFSALETRASDRGGAPCIPPGRVNLRGIEVGGDLHIHVDQLEE